jgi:hypothetical protein
MRQPGDVCRLLQSRVPWPAVLIFLLLSWNPQLHQQQNLQFVELFSGNGAITRAFKMLRWRGHAHDLCAHSSLDINGDAGYALALLSVLRCRDHGNVAMGPVCSSWVWVNRCSSADLSSLCDILPLMPWSLPLMLICLGVTFQCCSGGRDFADPMGYDDRERVAGANQMISRVVVIMLVCVARRLTFVVEQPSGSLMSRHTRWQYVLDNNFITLWQRSFFMGMFKAATLKPTTCWSNSKALLKFIMLMYKAWSSITVWHSSVRTTDVVVRPITGRKAVTGNAKLKQTQAYPQEFGNVVALGSSICFATGKTSKEIIELDQDEADDLQAFQAATLSGDDQWPDVGAFVCTCTSIPWGYLNCFTLSHPWFWSKAALSGPVKYLFTSKHTVIPPSWATVVRAAVQQLV